jgi:tetratricopeptide (TPR) repeat protein
LINRRNFAFLFPAWAVAALLATLTLPNQPLESVNKLHRTAILISIGMLLSVCGLGAPAAEITNQPATQIRIIELQGKVEIAPAGTTIWTSALTNQVLKPSDRLRTGPNSRVALRWSNESVIPFGASTEIEILPPQNDEPESGLRLVRGILSFFHRDKPGRLRVTTRGTTAGIEGTEFVLAVNDTDRTTVSVIDGRVRFGNEHATLVLTNGQQAFADPGQAPVQTAGFIANNVLQWCFYYPAILDLTDLPLTADEQSTLAESLSAYRSGDLLDALAKYPEGRQPGSNAERLYYAALLLPVGQVEQTEAALAALPADADRPQQLAAALQQLIAAVKRDPSPSTLNPQLSTELLASSYYEQSRGGDREGSLETALKLARDATAKSPEFGFAWTRVADLEFSFGNTRKAREALERGLALSPRNAQALALKGFLLAAENKTAEALTWFDRALAIDSALGNAWLGRGVCRIRRGDTAGGREDLLIAAALEPQRAGLRNYLGKAFGNAGDFPHAERELELAKKLDPNDPTPWLYSALVHQQNNRVNDAIRDLEKSQQLNDNRGVYRSQLLLNQDHAVRSANLAHIYADAGMTDVAVREASRAVTYDYANYSAHLFLANSYEAMRDRNNYNLRYGTPAFTEYFVANLLAPVDAGPLSPAISQNEYSRLFNQNHLGFLSSTEYLSRGAWSQSAVQYGTFDTFNYSLEGVYRTDPGQRVNNDFELKQIVLSIKQQITAQDSIYFRVDASEIKAGDVRQRYDPADAWTDLRSRETHEPDLALGYHHEWSPGIHTLLLLGRITDRTSASSDNVIGIVTPFSEGVPIGLIVFDKTFRIKSSQELYSAELQQIIQTPDHSTVFGALYQQADFDLRLLEKSFEYDIFVPPPPPIGEPPGRFTIANQNLTVRPERVSIYGYHSWQVFDPLLLVGGLSYDQIRYPQNWNSFPISDRQARKEQWSPKAGVVWTPARGTTVRGAYTRSLSGTSLDQSFRMEPTQVAGLNQSFRSLISESLVGATSGARFETFGITLEQKFETGTYIGLSGELLYSDVDRLRGTYFYNVDADEPAAEITDFRLRERLHSRERSLVFTIDQLLDREWTVGGRYRLTHAELDDNLMDSFDAADPDALQIPVRQDMESLLHQLNLHVNFNHASGLFSSFEAVWYRQENTEDLSNQPGDDFWHFNVLGGYRFCQRRARLELGVLNLSDQDYRLHPLVWHNDLPRHRTFVARFQFSF